MKVTATSDTTSFVGGEPPFLLFEIQFHSLFHVVESHKSEVGSGPIQYPTNPAAEVAFIGLVAHFEAFCKHQFAALINTDRRALGRFAQRRPQATMLLGNVAMLMVDSVDNIGPVVAEQYDFGSASMINGLFRDLVGVTPFSKDEACAFDRILSERHLFVHHAGIYTLHWLKKGSDLAKKVGAKMFLDRLSICTDQYKEKSDFLFDMAMKIARTTVRAAREIAADDGAFDGHGKQYEALLQGLYDSLE